jgi:hypothetical protein
MKLLRGKLTPPTLKSGFGSVRFRLLTTWIQNMPLALVNVGPLMAGSETKLKMLNS